MLNAVLDEGSQVRLADPAYGVDVSTGAVVLGQVAEEAAAREHVVWAVGPPTWGLGRPAPHHPKTCFPQSLANRRVSETCGTTG